MMETEQRPEPNQQLSSNDIEEVSERLRGCSGVIIGRENGSDLVLYCPSCGCQLGENAFDIFREKVAKVLQRMPDMNVVEVTNFVRCLSCRKEMKIGKVAAGQPGCDGVNFFSCVS